MRTHEKKELKKHLVICLKNYSLMGENQRKWTTSSNICKMYIYSISAKTNSPNNLKDFSALSKLIKHFIKQPCIPFKGMFFFVFKYF